MLNDTQKLFMIKAVQLKNKQGLDAVTWLQGCSNLTEDEIDSILTACGIEYTPSLDNVKAKKYKELSAICQKNIEYGVDVDINGVSEHFSYDTVDQSNIDDLMALVEKTGLAQPYHCDGGNCKLYTVEQVIAIYIAEKTNKAIQTTYFNQIREMIKNEYVTDNDIELVKGITWGMELAGVYLENYNAMLAQSQEIIKAIISKVNTMNTLENTDNVADDTSSTTATEEVA